MKKVSRNEICPCGSGKKYKQCCLHLDQAQDASKRAVESHAASEISGKLDAALLCHQAGQLAQAQELYVQILQLAPQHPDALHLLGTLSHQLGDNETAVELINRALDCKPDYAEAYCNLGNVFKVQGKAAQAAEMYRQAIALKPNFAQAHCNLGLVQQGVGKLNEAANSYQRAIAAQPNLAEAHFNLGVLLQLQGQLDKSITSYQQAISHKPDYAAAFNNLGVACVALGQNQLAEDSYFQALTLKPDYPEAFNNLGLVLLATGKTQAALESLYSAIELKPDYAEAHNSLGAAYKDLGQIEQAKEWYRKAYKLGQHGARVHAAMLLPQVMRDFEEIQRSRAEFEANLDELIADPVAMENPLVNGTTNFYLAYHGLNDKALQIKVAKYYEKVCPSLLFTAPHCTRTNSSRPGKIRIGFLSEYVYSHSVSLCVSKIVEALSGQGQFEVALISSHDINDLDFQNTYASFVGNRVQIPRNLERAREKIADLSLDILVYLDIGMEPLSYFLSFARLARYQCVYGGHPVTTGVGNMDYFLSSELMESALGCEHYSESLVQFPRSIFYFERPKLPSTFKTRRELGLPENRHIYMCPMKLQKIHPDFDAAIARILQKDADGVVVLFEDEKRSSWRDLLSKRFEKSIPAEERARVLFLPWIKNTADFISANAAADVVLDPFHFGIGSTAIFTFAVGTPIVTKPGVLMRGRVGLSYCKILDVMDCVADDLESYATKAVEIATDKSCRERIKKRIIQNGSEFFDNTLPIEELAVFFNRLAQGKQPVLAAQANLK